MRDVVPPGIRLTAAAVLPLSCSGCGLLGALFHEDALGIVIAAVVALAAAAFLFSKSARR